MLISQKFKTLTFDEYIFFIDNYKEYTNFNTLGLYRSIIENEKLNTKEKIEVRDYAHKKFSKTFDFLQLKDPVTYFEVLTIGEEITRGDEQKIWKDIRENQEKILKSKKIKHRNFGDYSKHNCGVDDCPFNGIMIKQGSFFAESSMHFNSDRNKSALKFKSDRLKSERKSEQQIIKGLLNE